MSEAADRVQVLLEEALEADDQKETRCRIRPALALLKAEEVTAQGYRRSGVDL